MNIFEAVVLLSPDISSNVRNSCLDNLVKIINERSGKVIDSEDWGLRDLSYKIDHFSKAFYNFYQIEIEGDKIENIKKSNEIGGFYGEKDIEAFKSILKDYTVNNQFDNEKLYNSFNEAEKKSIDTLTDINVDMTPMAKYVSNIIQIIKGFIYCSCSKYIIYWICFRINGNIKYTVRYDDYYYCSNKYGYSCR